jgi:hypothetical protein
VQFSFEDRTEQQGGDSQLHQVVQSIDEQLKPMRDQAPAVARCEVLKLGPEKAKRVEVVPNIQFVHSIDYASLL